VANKIKAIQRSFPLRAFWDDFKYHLMKWNIIKQLFPKVDLGIRQLIIFNEALLGK